MYFSKCKAARCSNIELFYDSKENLSYATMLKLVRSQSEDDCQSGYELLHNLKGHVTSVNALSFHPTGLFLASGCVKGWVNIWSLHVSVFSLYHLTEYFLFKFNKIMFFTVVISFFQTKIKAHLH